MKSVLALIIACFTFCHPALALTVKPLALDFRYGHYYSSFFVNADGSSTESHEWSKTVLKEAALERSPAATLP